MVRYEKVEFEKLASSQVSIAVSQTDGVTVGRPETRDGERITFTTAPYDPPIENAISFASRFATLNKVAVISVYDPENKWDPAWGDLR